MSQRKLTGDVKFIRTITPDNVSEYGRVNSINQTTGPLRGALSGFISEHGSDCNIHIAITVEQLTDSAGSPLMTRGAGR